MTMVIDGTAGVVFPDTSVQAKAVPAAPQSMVRLNTANGYGSTNTVISRFITVVTNQGSDITYADSATLGASFTINTNGVYAISYTDGTSQAGGGSYGLSVNSTQLTTTIQNITAADRLCYSDSAAPAYEITVSTTAFLPSGYVVRPHCAVNTTSVAPARSQFTITRVA